MDSPVRVEVRVTGVVQGVGYRPFVHALATRYRLAGQVGNDTAGVFIDAEGPSGAIDGFLTALRSEAPPLAEVERVTVRRSSPSGHTGFIIAASDAGGERTTLVSADSATCADCLTELADPTDRRYRYPFINCTNCGPRFTIVRDVPYDRPLTTMAGFTMCPPCAREYHDPTDRRFHAQPVCCPECGPRMELLDARREVLDGEAIAAAARLLREGKVLAVKGLGGYHLAVDAGDEAAAAALRARKHREDKPFAVMAATVAAARELAAIDASAAELLTSRHRPIVLLARRPDAAVAASVAPGNRELGVMLPYTPLHHLLLAAVGRPIVLTSGNVSDEPIAFRDGDAFERLLGIADAFLTHDRAIHIRTDDSVARSWRGNPMLLRRSRGYVPEPVSLPMPFQRQVLACGAELKNTFCLGKDRHAFISHHVGDLENYETLRSFTDGIAHFQRLFEIEPSVLAHDLHPDYLSTKYALERSLDNDVDLVGVQHHHAHIASCLADNAEEGPVIGVAFDGTGFGTDGTVWGGEFLLAELSGFRRLAHLVPVPLPGGATAIRQPWRMAVSYLDAAFDGRPPARLDVLRRHE
ncbi:MAG: carbamoyltransferase HypF, partial [Sciscionella sp.]